MVLTYASYIDLSILQNLMFFSYAEFVETSCKLNELENYPHLNAMCKGSGIRVTKIVFRGYFAAPKIQANHDEAIDKRTNLQMQVIHSPYQ